ncbi:2-C-methyl-D-erythritol 2,4-cyclodiphosphate synthase [BD1-7 clade bacterium]|uniref:2-C-methyl-D-erythritol 2,4-cyclodiphosphate synthase n=1 Tax=BD1-7 clade bacterium TaxID=2029982 RepID=A0A5S9P751_9GAMM|nr:2-C-methyl-D-erythritol 2,4-cyclodiphosphate synthase [BD1-7 clade bacterium]
MRIGHGYDVHKFGDGDHVVLGGVRIEHSHGLIAHSDGDVLLHALSDALLGAAALGDIGKHFPDTDSAYENADSRVLLRHVVQRVANEGYIVSNVDVTLIAQAPRVSTFTDAMCTNIAADLGLGRTQVNVKATTTEKLGFIGEKKGIAAEAVALLLENKV